MSIKIGAAYIRVSTDDQVEYSPESQIAKIKDLAKRDGYLIPDEYFFQDDGISGKRADRRPAFRLMIAQAKQEQPPFDRIYVWEFSRFARNQEESIMYKNLLRKNGVEVRSVREPLSDSPFSSLIERIIEWMDEYYLINLAAEVRRGMTEKASRGEAMGTAPFGYTCRDKTFYPNEHADTVRWIYAAYLSGSGVRKIATGLRDRGVRTRRGNIPDNRWVMYILTNPVYAGKIRWSTEGHANYGRTRYDDSNVMIVDGRHEPIIDTETWDAVQARVAEARNAHRYIRADDPHVFMLRGLLRCSACGSTLTYSSAYSPSVQCHKYARGQCKVSHHLSLRKADATVIAALEHAVENFDFPFAPTQPKTPQVVHDWERLIASEEAKLTRARSALLDGAFTPEEYKAAKQEIEENLSMLRAGMEAEAAESPSNVDPAVYAEKVRRVLDVIKSPDASDASKNEALRTILDHAVYNKAEKSIDLFFA